ncbi:MAG: right-handed parallel beta-helix repeat-containing protein [Pyrinomonadaceae bacterium MAG19_C2-C3]|nr:right-handed parallel beta-helix repeat-containing protein [Pyrinomonadaceae bacterium MAG19_C2-C3]
MQLLQSFRLSSLSAVAPFALCVAVICLNATSVFANHLVLLEGNCPTAGDVRPTNVTPNTCGDYDGDGRIGTAEDTDGDQVFGTLTAALGSDGINQNGNVTFVTSGVFNQSISISSLNVNVTVQAAPGVEAVIDAVRRDNRRNADRQGSGSGINIAPGLGDSFSNVVIRNLTVRNWANGASISGNVRVTIENCRFENNLNYGINVRGRAQVMIAKTEVHSTGYRQPLVRTDTGETLVPSPGTGISFERGTSGSVFLTTVSNSFAVGIENNNIGSPGAVCASLVNVFNNNTNFENVRPTSEPCGGGIKRPRDFFDR